MARKAVALALLALLTAIGSLAEGAAPATAEGCPNVDTPAAQLTLREFDGSVFCLVNRRRAENGRSQLRPNPLLHRAAWSYSNALLVGRFFSHHGDFAGHRNASTVIGRLRRIGYVRPGYVWIVGEDLRWSAPDTSSPGQVVQAWMDSAIHRMYLLKPRFDELGVAGARGTPIDADQRDGITVAAEFGLPEELMVPGTAVPSRTLQGESYSDAWNLPGPGGAVAILWLRRPPTEPEVRSQIGSQEPMRIGPPGSLRPLTSSLQT